VKRGVIHVLVGCATGWAFGLAADTAVPTARALSPCEVQGGDTEIELSSVTRTSGAGSAGTERLRWAAATSVRGILYCEGDDVAVTYAAEVPLRDVCDDVNFSSAIRVELDDE
jgi:hypothetical protein